MMKRRSKIWSIIRKAREKSYWDETEKCCTKLQTKKNRLLAVLSDH